MYLTAEKFAASLNPNHCNLAVVNSPGESGDFLMRESQPATGLWR